MSNSNKMLKTAGFMTIATLLAKVCGMFRDMLIAAYFSTSYVSDAYMTATKLPTMLFDLVIGGVITASFIPVFNGILQKKDKKEAMDFANRFVGMVLGVSVLVAIVGIIFSNPLIKFLAPDFDLKTHNLAAQLSSIMFPMIIFTGLAFSFVGILQSFGEFNIPSIMSLVSNLTVIAYFPIFGKKFGVHGLALTMLIAWSLQVIIQIPALKKTGYKFRPRLNFKDPYIKEALILAGPLLISTWVSPLYSIVNTRIASGVAGGVTMLEYANRLYTVMVGVFSFVVTNLIFPKLSVSNASENYEEANELLSTSLKSILIIILPLMAGLIILGRPVISVVYEHGNFTTEDALRTGTALSCYCVGMIGFSLNEMLSKAFFSKKNSKTPMYNAIASMLINIALAYTLSARLGIYGLALATACGSSANALLNYITMRLKYGKIFKHSDIISILKTIISAILMSVTVVLAYNKLSQLIGYSVSNNLLICVVCAVIGIVVYFTLCLILGVDEIKKIVKRG